MKGNIHGSVFDFKGQWYVAYHDLFPTDKYRMTCLERIHYLSNGDIAEVKSTKEGVGWYNGNEKIEAEDYFEKSNDITYTNHDTTDFHMRHIKDGNWLRFPNVKLPFDFTNQFSTRVATADEGGIIEIILDSLDGRKAGEIKAKNTGGWNNWQVFNTAVDSISGTHDIYLKFSGAHTMRLNLDWFRLY